MVTTNATTTSRHELIESHLPLAKSLAWKRKSSLLSVSYDELKAAAYFGLVTAAKKYDSSQSHFSHYARIKIEGAIGDYLRELRGSRTHDAPQSLDDAPEGGISRKDMLPSRRTLSELIISFAEGLSENHQKIFSMYYLEGLSLKEISGKLGVVESRISQILKGCRNQLREIYDVREMAA